MKLPTSSTLIITLALSGLSANGATISIGDLTTLGTRNLLNQAATGGNDVTNITDLCFVGLLGLMPDRC